MLRNERCEQGFKRFENGSMDGVFTDPPFNASELTDGEKDIVIEGHAPMKRDLAEWDKGFSPHFLIQESARIVKPGGFLVIKTSDVNFGMVREFGVRSPETLGRYIEFLGEMNILSIYSVVHALRAIKGIPKIWGYFCTITWHKTNPAPRMRKTTPHPSVEYLQVLKRLDEKGKPVPAFSFNFIDQSAEMHNFIGGPICSEPERLYWHKVNGEIVPCPKKGCPNCALEPEYNRISHPTQTPLYVWEWIFRRFTNPGMRIYDPYAGLGTTIMANRRSKFGLEIDASEMNADYVRVHEMWKSGVWTIPQLPPGVEQVRMF